MGNRYEGTKFSTELQEIELESSEAAEELIKWSKMIADLNCSPALEGGFGGNISCRTKNGFLITAAGISLGQIDLSTLVEVTEIDSSNLIVSARGLRLPSSESILHGAVYKKRPEIRAVFHGHFPVCEENFIDLGLMCTKEETPYGSIELVESVMDVMGKENFIILKHHGFLSLGKTAQAAGEQLLSICSEAASCK